MLAGRCRIAVRGTALRLGNDCVVPIEVQHGGAAPPGGVIDAVPARPTGYDEAPWR